MRDELQLCNIKGQAVPCQCTQHEGALLDFHVMCSSRKVSEAA
jgi:hypothetical protein